MKITLFDAGGGEVTGSAYAVQSGKSTVLVECGLFQGVPNADQKNRISQQFTFRNLDSVLLTHACRVKRNLAVAVSERSKA